MQTTDTLRDGTVGCTTSSPIVQVPTFNDWISASEVRPLVRKYYTAQVPYPSDAGESSAAQLLFSGVKWPLTELP